MHSNSVLAFGATAAHVQPFRIERNNFAPVTILHMEHNSIRKILKTGEGGGDNKTSRQERCKLPLFLRLARAAGRCGEFL